MRRACALILLTLLGGALGAAERPNIVFICADDLGVNDLACYGRSDHRTPHLDRLAAEGVRFTTAYCAQPICSPTRAALMTGKSPARLHLTTFLPGRADARSQMLLHPAIARELPLAEETIGEMLSAAGYATACIGKWHLGGAGFGPAEQGFASVFPGKANTTPSAEEGGKGEYALTAQAVQFIEANRARPFFLYLAHNNPHVPLDAQRERIAKHDAAFNPVYAAMIETLDECVGNLVATIDRLGLREKTLVVFTSDNGGLHVLETNKTPATHNTPYRAGKGYLYEGGLRIPLIVRWPGTIAGNVIEPTPVISMDWVPTLLEVAGVRPPAARFDGVSLASLLSARAALPARPLYWHFPHYTNQGGRPGGAVREDAWKLIEHYEDGRAELFHLGNDPGETTDLSASEPKRAAELRGKLAIWRETVGAQTNRPNPRFDASLAARIYRAIDSSRLNTAPRAEPMRAQLAGWRAALNEALKDDPAAKVAPVIILHAKDALIDGKTVRYEREPQKNTIGFWTDPADRIRWTFELSAGGDFDVELLQGCKGGGSEVEIRIGESSLRITVKDTGHFQNFVPVTAGRVTLAPGRHTLVVAPRTKRGPAVMDLRSIVLRPVAPAAPAL